MEELTLEKLKSLPPHSIFATGLGLITHPWFNNARPVNEGGTLAEDGRSTLVRWVALRGGIHDWAIYHSMDANLVDAPNFDDPSHLLASPERIAHAGAKLYDSAKIKEFVPCDDEAFAMYRF